jgi:hypothetical protein
MPHNAEQEAAAEAADRMRRRRRDLVQEIADGRVELAEVVTSDDAAAVKLVTLAEAVPGVGKVRSRRVLEVLGLQAGTRWGEIAPATAEAVVAALQHAATDGGASPAAGT